MDSQPLGRLVSRIIWTIILFLSHAHSQQDLPTLTLGSRVFVALKGKDLTVDCTVRKPANQSADMLKCFSPDGTEIQSHDIFQTYGDPRIYDIKVTLKALTISGEYYCNYQTAKAYLYVYVRDEGFKMPAGLDIEIILMAVFNAVLLIFSVVGSVYVFRGHWITKCRKTNEKGDGSEEDKKKGSERKEDNIPAVTDPSTSFYASLEPRTRSIYDELHPSPIIQKPDHEKTKPEKRKPHQSEEQNIQHPDEGQLDSVYENY